MRHGVHSRRQDEASKGVGNALFGIPGAHCSQGAVSMIDGKVHDRVLMSLIGWRGRRKVGGRSVVCGDADAVSRGGE